MPPRHREVDQYQPEVILPVNRVFIGNRGEIAVRGILAARNLGKTAVLGVANQDVDSLATRTVLDLAQEDGDSAVALLVGNDSLDTYERVRTVLNTAVAYDCDAFFPGYGFLAERGDAARELAQAGVRFIGPPPDVIERVGNKISGRQLAIDCDVPVLPGTEALNTYAEARRAARKIGYPVIVKAEDSGGGSGNVQAKDKAELEEGYTSLAHLYTKLYIEKFVPDARHIEVQIVGDKYGNVVALGERDCSPQRNFQKVVEESPAPDLPARLRQKMSRDAIKMAKTAGYHGLGTWEYLWDKASGKYYFMEINPRIQVEHPVTEERYGIDLVELQFKIEEGHRLPDDLLASRRSNHVMEARLYAEKSVDFEPDSGVLELLELPEVEGVRIDRGYDQGDTVPAEFDKTIAKIISVGKNREEARAKLEEALGKTLITGMSTNREFLLWLISSKDFRDGNVSIGSIGGAWKRHQYERFHGAEGFLGESSFTPIPNALEFDPDLFPQSLTYTKAGVARDYAADREKSKERGPNLCAFQYGILHDEAADTEFVYGNWDFKKGGGTLGVEEGNAVSAAIVLAHERNLPFVMTTTSAGATQQQNTLSLIQLRYTMATLKRYRPPLFVNIFTGLNFGGVTASIASGADIQIAVEGSKIGLTGPEIVATQIMALNKKEELPAGAHGTADHFRDRNIDLVVADLQEAKQSVLALFSILGFSDSKVPYKFQPRKFDTGQSTLYNQPETARFQAIISTIGRTIFNRREPAKKFEGRAVPSRELTPVERLKLVESPDRPTASDLLNPELGIFDRVSPLSNITQTGERTYQAPSIIAAIAEADGQAYYVIGQQTYNYLDEDGVLRKGYRAQGPNDLRWKRRHRSVAEWLNIPIIEISDSMGADASLEAESGGINLEISADLAESEDVNTPVYTLIIGQGGSGGALTSSGPLDGAAAFSNEMTYVSHPTVQTWILTGQWPKAGDIGEHILNQLKDGTAEGLLASGQIDKIIQEPIGGVQTDWRSVAPQIRNFLREQRAKLKDVSRIEHKARRYQRIEAAARYATKPNSIAGLQSETDTSD